MIQAEPSVHRGTCQEARRSSPGIRQPDRSALGRGPTGSVCGDRDESVDFPFSLGLLRLLDRPAAIRDLKDSPGYHFRLPRTSHSVVIDSFEADNICLKFLSPSLPVEEFPSDLTQHFAFKYLDSPTDHTRATAIPVGHVGRITSAFKYSFH
jgi:hypothetical protein